MKTALTLLLTTLCSVSAFGLHGITRTKSHARSIDISGVKKMPMVQGMDFNGRQSEMVSHSFSSLIV